MSSASSHVWWWWWALSSLAPTIGRRSDYVCVCICSFVFLSLGGTVRRTDQHCNCIGANVSPQYWLAHWPFSTLRFCGCTCCCGCLAAMCIFDITEKIDFFGRYCNCGGYSLRGVFLVIRCTMLTILHLLNTFPPNLWTFPKNCSYILLLNKRSWSLEKYIYWGDYESVSNASRFDIIVPNDE